MIRFGDEDYSKLYEAMTSTMPLVRILTFYHTDFDPTPQRANVMIKWLQSMPQITYLRIGTVTLTPAVFDLFLHDPKTMGSLDEATNGEIVCPKLAFIELEFENIEMIEMIIRWARIRKQMGSPIRKVYLRPNLAHNITPELSQRLAAVLGNGISYIIPGTKSEEEKMLMNEGKRIQKTMY